MTISNELFNAILSLDAYNRGYDASIELPDSINTQIGTATITMTRGQSDAQDIGFYALAYNYNGETIVSIRGTDDGDEDSQDQLDNPNGWGGKKSSITKNISTN